MASTTYTAAQLYGTNGEGTSSINLSSSVQYLFSIDSTLGSSYFTMETVRNNNIIDIVPQLKEELRFRLYGKLASEYK